MESEKSVKRLNLAQKVVVAHKNGPLLVVAGAGTGKTGVIVERINQTLEDGVEPSQILAVTFTEKAAAEMLERVLELRSGFELELPIFTFNAFGESLLKEFNTDIGLSRNFLLVGDNAKIVFLRQQLEALELDYYSPISNPEGMLPDLADYFSKLKQQVITPREYEAYISKMPASDEAEQIEKKRHQELARAYGNYIELCKKQNIIDYDDQIYRVIELLKERPNIRKQLQERYHSIMIDEFQDTNPMQSQLIDLLVNKDKNLVVVGDDDQSIYGFRGATLANILQFKDRYPEAKEVTLTENYRSTSEILDTSYQLIQNNNPDRLELSLGINKQLTSKKSGEVPTLKQFGTLDLELYWVAEDIKRRIDNGESPGSIAVLCRRNTTSQLIRQSLELAEVEAVVIGERHQLYKTEVVRMLVEAIKAIIDSEASTSLYHTLSGALFNCEISLLSTLANQAKRSHLSLSEVIKDIEDETFSAIKSAYSIIESWRDDAAIIPVGRLAYKIIDESGFKDRITSDSLTNNESANSILQLSNFFKTLKEFESIAIQPTAIQYIESYAVLEAAGETSEDGTLDVDNERVTILTIHKSKGLEWNTVYIPDCTEGSFPLRAHAGGIKLPEGLIKNSTDADKHYQEERRLMYVALTRARENLILSYANKHYSPSLRKPSRFIVEIFGEQNPIEEFDETQPNVPVELLSQSSSNMATVTVPKIIYDGKRIRLSVSQITKFISCPLDFYYRYVLSVPEPPSSAASYGTVIHELIETINKALVSGDNLELETLEKDLDLLWKPTGFISKEHERRSYAQALATIREFYLQHYIENKKIPSKVESSFSLTLRPENVSIKGRLDAVFETDSGIEIIDYKTSSAVSTPEKAKARASSSDQLTLYALIWQELYGELPAKLSLLFVDTNQVGSIRKTDRGIATMRSKIADIAKDIRNNSFKPGKDHKFCIHPELTT